MFRKFNGEKLTDFVSYVDRFVKTHDNIDVFVTTDSQNLGFRTVFSTVISMYDSGTNGHGHGGHCIYNKWFTQRYPKDRMVERLLKEVEASIETGKELRNGGVNVKYIDVDINPDVKERSSQVAQAAYGWIKAEGFNYRDKGDTPTTTNIADMIVKS